MSPLSSKTFVPYSSNPCAIEPEERAKILEQLHAAGAPPDARDYVSDQLDRPLDVEGLLGWIDRSDPALRAEVYVASRVVIALR